MMATMRRIPDEQFFDLRGWQADHAEEYGEQPRMCVQTLQLDRPEQVGSITDQPIKYVLNTHHHGDHAGSNPDFMQSAEVIAHKNARANIIRNNLAGAPRVIFADETAVFLGDAEVQMHHFGRGHTNGDAVV